MEQSSLQYMYSSKVSGEPAFSFDAVGDHWFTEQCLNVQCSGEGADVPFVQVPLVFVAFQTPVF